VLNGLDYLIDYKFKEDVMDFKDDAFDHFGKIDLEKVERELLEEFDFELPEEEMDVVDFINCNNGEIDG